MRKTALFIFILLFTFLVISCKKEKTQSGVNNNEPPAKGIPPFSGKWKGTISVVDINPTICYYGGSPISTTQEWVVNPDSTVTITETNLDYNTSKPWTQIWKGRIYNQDSLSITLTRDIKCFDVSLPMTTSVKIKIEKAVNGKYSLTAKVDYPMCPPDCLFTFNYLVNKQE